MSLDVREIARRAVGKVLAERGRVEHAVAHPAQPSLGGVHVHVELPQPPAAARGGRELVTAECLASVANGGTLSVEVSAVITPLAQEEAHRRGIRFTRGSAPSRLRVAVGSDHGGFAAKKDVLTLLGELGCSAQDFGTRDENAVDYPDFARAVAEAVASGQCDLGVVIDGAGIGSAIAANKVPGIRAATCCDVAMAKNAREHNFANVLSLGGKMLQRPLLLDVVRAFLATPTGEERHRRRVEKISEIERRYSKGASQGVRA
jgi:ribose 5-phosphate isomerase B